MLILLHTHIIQIIQYHNLLFMSSTIMLSMIYHSHFHSLLKLLSARSRYNVPHILTISCV